MSRFKPGDQVVCVKNGNWRSRKTNAIVPGPAFNEIVTVSEIAEMPGDILLDEYPAHNGVIRSYPERSFEPLISDAILAEELATVREPEILEFDRMLKRVLG